MDPAGVRSVLQTQLIKLMESRKHAHLHEYNFSLSVHFVRSASEGLGAIYPAAKWTQTTGGGRGIISMEMTLLCSARRMWEDVCSAQFDSCSKV